MLSIRLNNTIEHALHGLGNKEDRYYDYQKNKWIAPTDFRRAPV